VLINTIPLLEARASSEIENIVTTADRLFRFAAEEEDAGTTQADPATKEALRYRTALRRGFDSLAKKPLSTSTAVDVCRTIRGVQLDVRKVPGTALTNQATGKVIYTPPGGESRLRDLLANWMRRQPLMRSWSSRSRTTSSKRSTPSPTATAARGVS
jgi:cell filamentation protein, protein adenylyltransferase